jgi:predicted transcriptional regulator
MEMTAQISDDIARHMTDADAQYDIVRDELARQDYGKLTTAKFIVIK